MLKRIFSWRYLIAVVIILGGCIYVSRQDQKTRDQYEQKCNQLNASAVAPTGHYEDCDKGAENAARHLPRWYRVFGWPEGITTWAILLTLLALAEQTSQTRRAADATAETANAAYGSLTFAEAQMDLMKEEKRARLDLNVERIGLEVEVAGEDLVHLIAVVSVRNIGESKAFIGRTSGILITKLRNDPLGDIDYSPLDLPEKFIEPDKTPVAVKVYCFPSATTATFAECLEGGTFSLHLFGFIEYETLGFWRRKEFGYDWKVLDRNSGLAGLYGLRDPYPNSPRPARDRITYGYWAANEEKEKPEYPISSPEQSKRPEEAN
jgi:hypothetical protein